MWKKTKPKTQGKTAYMDQVLEDAGTGGITRGHRIYSQGHASAHNDHQDHHAAP